VLYLRLIILSVRGDVPINSDALLVADFMNLKIKPDQSFGSAHRARVCVRVFIGVSAHTCMSIYVCTVFLKNKLVTHTHNSQFSSTGESEYSFLHERRIMCLTYAGIEECRIADATSSQQLTYA
jgi:hypothetical protein